MKRWAEGKAKLHYTPRNPSLSIAQGKIAALKAPKPRSCTASGMAPSLTRCSPPSKPRTKLSRRRKSMAAPYASCGDVFPGLGITGAKVETDLRRIETFSPAPKSLHRNAHQPTVRLVDLNKAIAFAKKHISSRSSTTLSPRQPPATLSLGFDMVFKRGRYQRTRRHSDVIAGAVAAAGMDGQGPAHGDLSRRPMDPEAAFLLSRGIKTLAIRVKRQG